MKTLDETGLATVRDWAKENFVTLYGTSMIRPVGTDPNVYTTNRIAIGAISQRAYIELYKANTQAYTSISPDTIKINVNNVTGSTGAISITSTGSSRTHFQVLVTRNTSTNNDDVKIIIDNRTLDIDKCVELGILK